MTNEQLNHYEALSNLVDHQFEEVLTKTMQLASMSLQDGETSSAYLTRVQDKIHEINVAEMHMDEAKANKRAFVMAI